MLQVNMHEAKTRLSQLVELVKGGERVVIARDGVPVAELVRLEPAQINRRGGQWKGKARIASDFDAPMPELEELFGG
jgi:antitoxin (DNA-binding transcriptional repressor) of toxin-antitoxin stability system